MAIEIRNLFCGKFTVSHYAKFDKYNSQINTALLMAI